MVVNAQRQREFGCGVFTTGYAVDLLQGEDPCTLQLEFSSQSVWRHILNGLASKNRYPFPACTVYRGPLVSYEVDAEVKH